MTVIVYDNETGLVLVDSRTSWSNGRPPAVVNKIRTTEWNGASVTYTSCGTAVISPVYLHSCLRAIDDGSLIVHAPTKEFIGYAVFFSYRGKLWLSEARYEDNDKVADVVDLTEQEHDVVAGSGGGFYSAYVAAGQPVLTAISMVAAFDVTCGFPIRYFCKDGVSGIARVPDVQELRLPCLARHQ